MSQREFQHGFLQGDNSTTEDQLKQQHTAVRWTHTCLYVWTYRISVCMYAKNMLDYILVGVNTYVHKYLCVCMQVCTNVRMEGEYWTYKCQPCPSSTIGYLRWAERRRYLLWVPCGCPCRVSGANWLSCGSCSAFPTMPCTGRSNTAWTLPAWCTDAPNRNALGFRHKCFQRLFMHTCVCVSMCASIVCMHGSCMCVNVCMHVCK